MKCHWFLTQHCKSCSLLDLSYLATIKNKDAELTSLFKGSHIQLQESIPCDPISGSRNKAKFALRAQLGEIEFGFYDAQLNFKKLEECPLHLEGINGLLPELKAYLKQYNITPYDLTTKKGELKYVIISKSQQNQECLIRFIVRSKESLDRIRKLSSSWEETSPHGLVISVNIQPDHKAILEGDEEIVVSKKQRLDYQMGEVHLSLGAKSFFQVTPNIALKLYEKVRDLIQEHKIHSLLDLYCGVGAFSFFAAKSCENVLGVELSTEAIQAAIESKNKNQFTGRLNFKSLDVEQFLDNSEELEGEFFEAILVNPPRRGLSPKIILNIKRLKPRLIIYSSCQAASLARDVKMFEDDYFIQSSQIFDMFPFTEHYETLMILVRK